MNSQQAFYVWILFNLGILLHMLIQALGSIASTSNSISSFSVWWEYNWRELCWRIGIDGSCWILWMIGPIYLGQAAAHLIPPASFAVAPWIGFTADRFTHSLGFILRFNTREMSHVAPPE